MLRYRCPQCTQLLQANELRAGKKSVCTICFGTHIVPIDRSAWLNEAGEPLFPNDAASRDPSTPTTPVPHAVAPAAKRVSSIGEIIPTSAFLEHADELPPENPALARVRSDTPPPQPSRLPTADAKAERALIAESSEPVHVRTQSQIAEALSEVLARRMKPPRNPRKDLRLSTAGWLVLTGLGIALVLVTFVTRANYSRTIFLVGVAQALIGYGWIIWLTSRRHPLRGFICAVPVFTPYYLVQWKYAWYRPLRFVTTGVLLVVCSLLTSRLAPTVRHWLGIGQPPPMVKPVDPMELSSLERLREFNQQRSYDKLIDLLHDLAKTDSLKSVDAKDGPELAVELKKLLCSHLDTGVRVAALAAYARWGGIDARDACLSAIKSESEEERLMALQLLPQWKGTDAAAQQVADHIASLIRQPGVQSNRAELALIEIGGVVAERATLAVFLQTDDLKVRLVTLSILEKVGGDETVKELQAFATTQIDQTLKAKALDTVQRILKRPKPKP